MQRSLELNLLLDAEGVFSLGEKVGLRAGFLRSFQNFTCYQVGDFVITQPDEVFED